MVCSVKTEKLTVQASQTYVPPGFTSCLYVDMIMIYECIKFGFLVLYKPSLMGLERSHIAHFSVFLMLFCKVVLALQYLNLFIRSK